MYIGDEEFFLFDSGFSISKHLILHKLDENFLKLPSKEFSKTSKNFQNSGESGEKKTFFGFSPSIVLEVLFIPSGLNLDLELLYRLWFGHLGN
jgi:hypothetical protein